MTSFNATMGALAARQQELSTTIALLPPTLRAADSALGPLQASFGPTQEFAKLLTPSVKQTAPTITAGLPWLAQSEQLLSPAELGGLLNSLTPAVQGTASTLNSSKALLNGSDQLAKCFVHTVIPTGNERLSDPPLTTGLQVYQELFQSAVGLAGIGQNFDGNGRYVRVGGRRRLGPGRHRVAARRRPAVRQRGVPVAGRRAPRTPASSRRWSATSRASRTPPPNLNAAKTGVGP